MAHLAIKGHKERGKEVIALLEMLGGKNRLELFGNQDFDSYWISGNETIFSGYVKSGSGSTIFTLEEFEKEFPYKVGDKVNVCGENAASVIGMRWESDYVVYRVRLEKNDYETSKTIYELQPYAEQKEEVVPDEAKAPSLIWQQYSEGRFVCKLPEDMELDKIEDGVILLKPKGLPKSYKECFKILYGNYHHVVYVAGLDGLGNAKDLFESFIKLKICRDAYWTLADGWKPDWSKPGYKYCIKARQGKLWKCSEKFISLILAFPTEEMRDTFYENFKDLINECEELL